MSRARQRQQPSEAEPRTDSSSPPTKIRQKFENQQRASNFWDDLSKQWLTRSALREFDRRTVRLTALVPPDRTGKEVINPAQLTRFARIGGPSLEDLRGYPDPGTAHLLNRAMAPRQSSSRKRANSGSEPDIPSKRTKISVQNRRLQAVAGNTTGSGRTSNISRKKQKTLTYDKVFEQHLIDHGVYPPGYDADTDPANLEEIGNRLAQPRLSLSSSRCPPGEFQIFRQKDRLALNKGMVMSDVFPTIAGSAPIPKAEGMAFTNLRGLTDGYIKKARPDFYDGARPADLSIHIREELGDYIVPSTDTSAPCLPNFFAEASGPKGHPDVSQRKALYDGALGARGVHELRSYIGPEKLFDNNAYTITSTYSGGYLLIYCVHPTPSAAVSNRIDYRMTIINGWGLTGNPAHFRQGVAALRNARDWAKEKRAELIAAANSKAQNANRAGSDSTSEGSLSPSSNEPSLSDPAMSADELAPDSAN